MLSRNYYPETYLEKRNSLKKILIINCQLLMSSLEVEKIKTNYKIQITNKLQITMSEITKKMEFLSLQTMTAFNQKLLWRVQGGVFL